MRWIGLLLLLAQVASAQEGRATKQKISSPPAAQQVPSVWDAGSLGAQAAQLSKAYQRSGHVHRLKPTFISEEQQKPVVVPHRLLDSAKSSCITVAALAAPNISFLLTFPQTSDEPARRAWPIPSAAGAAEVTRCGAQKEQLLGLCIKLRSRRGVVEFVVVESENPPPPVSELLPSRNPGPSLPSPQIGKRPWLAPLKERVDFLRRARRGDGAYAIHESALSTDETGRGSTVLQLGPGCHRLEMLTDASPEAPPDLDGKLSTLAQGVLVSADEEHRSQVSLRHCVGRSERFRLDYAGAVPLREVILIHSTWPIPDAFPQSWGSLARARLAQVAWERGQPDYGAPPVYSSMGVRGTTRVVVPTDPMACYVANLAVLRGEVTTLALAARVGAASSEAHQPDGAGVSVAFCADGARSATLELQTHGTGVAWILGVWRVGSQK